MGNRLSSYDVRNANEKGALDARTLSGAANPLFGVFELARHPLTHRRAGAKEQQLCTPQFCNRLLELVLDNEESSLEYLLRDPPCPTDSVAVKDHCVSHYSLDGFTVFHYAAKQQATGILKALVEFCEDGIEGINAKTHDSHEFTALHIAVRNRSLDCVQALLQHRYIQLNEEDVDGWTPLHHACFHGSVDLVLALQEANFCAPNSEGDYPLHLAATEHRTNVFSKLRAKQHFMEAYKRNSAFKSLQDRDGNTLLHIAVDAENVEIVDFCLELGMDVREKNKEKSTSLHVAARRGCVGIARKLIAKEQALGHNVREFLCLKDKHKASSLYLAAKFSNTAMVKYLLDSGADIEATSTLGFTPLLAAVRYTNLKCVQILLSRNASILVKDRKRHFSALFWAVELQSPEILRAIVDCARKTPEVWNKIWKDTDPHGNTAHHIAAKARNLDILETLVLYNTSCLEATNKDGCNPFHMAVKEGKLAIVGYIISNAASSIHTVDGFQNTGLHLAAEKGHMAIAERLVSIHDFGHSVFARNINGCTPIHLAAMNGHPAVVEFLIEHSPKDAAEILDNDHATALYLACQRGHAACVEVLLKCGAMVTYVYYIHHNQEKKKKSCLEVAIDRDHPAVVQTIINSSNWKQALQYCSDPQCKDGETPVRKLIKKLPAAASLVFDKCVNEHRLAGKRGGFYYKVNYNYEFLEDFVDLFEDQGPKFTPDPGIRVELPASARTESAAGTVGEVIANEAAVSTTSHSHVRTEQVVPLHFHHHEPKAQSCDLYRSWGPVKYHYQNHPLHLMVFHSRQELLKHPLVASFIHYKWNLFGRYIYYPNILTYIFLMLMLTVYMFLRFDYSKERASATNQTLSDCSNTVSLESLLENATNSTLTATRELIDQLERNRSRLIICSVIIILNCVVRIAMEIAQIYHHLGDYFTEYINYLEGFLYVATIIFVSNFQLNCLPSWQWQLGAVCIFLSWMNFILFLSQQPMVGIYVVMFQHIIKTFLRMFPMSVLLILAFGQPFFMLLSTVEIDQPPQQFVTFPYSLLKTIIMTIGEFETDPIFFGTPSVIVYPWVTYLLWVIFLVIMPILLQNMLVGLAVDDIKGVHEKAALKREAIQIEFILDVISRLPKPLIRKYNEREYTQTWGKGLFDKMFKWISGSYWKPELRRNNIQYSMFLKMENMTDTLTSLEHRLQSLTEQSAKLERLMLHFAQEQEKYLEPARQRLLLNRKSMFHSQPATLHLLHSRDTDSEEEFEGNEGPDLGQEEEDSV